MEKDSVVDEWLQWARRIGTGGISTISEFKSCARDLSPEVVEELGAFYSRAKLQNHVANIEAWLSSLDRQAPMIGDELAIRNLYCLFCYLSTVRRVAPFSGAAFPWFRVPPVVDWNNVPAEFRFLEHPAVLCRKFAYIASEEGQENIRENVTPEERQVLLEIAVKINALGSARLQKWISSIDKSVHVEAAFVSNLVGCLDALGLPYF